MIYLYVLQVPYNTLNYSYAVLYIKKMVFASYF